VLFLGGIVWMLLGMLLPMFGIRELLGRLRHRRLRTAASDASSADSLLDERSESLHR
jgi:hypothetical protein